MSLKYFGGLSRCMAFYVCSNLLTYLHTPWMRVLLENLTVNIAASQEIPRIYGTRKSLTLTTSARHLSVSSYKRLYHLVSFAWISSIKDLYCTDLRRRSRLSTAG
jgi:hypothetical protein